MPDEHETFDCIYCGEELTEDCCNIFYCEKCDVAFEVINRDECIKQNYPLGCMQIMIDLQLEGDICPGYDECTKYIQERSKKHGE